MVGQNASRTPPPIASVPGLQGCTPRPVALRPAGPAQRL